VTGGGKGGSLGGEKVLKKGDRSKKGYQGHCTPTGGKRVNTTKEDKER